MSPPASTAPTARKPFARVVEGALSFLDGRVGGIGDAATDNVAAWSRAMALLSGGGGELFFPPGVYGMASQPTPVPGGVLLRGTGFDYADPTTVAPARASVIRALATMDRLVTLSPVGSYGFSTAGNTGASMQDLIADGRDLAASVVSTQGRRNYIRDCQVYWGADRGIDVSGQNTYVQGGVVAQHARGDCIAIRNSGDHKIMDGQQRECGAAGACIRVGGPNVADIQIRGNHMWTGANSVSLNAQALIVLDATGYDLSNMSIIDNIIEGNIGPEVMLIVPATRRIRALKINDNTFFNADSDVANGVITMTGNGDWVTSTIIGNSIDGAQADPYKSILDFQGTPSSTLRLSMIGNVGMWVNNLITGTPPNRVYQRGNSIRTATAGTNSDASGTVTRSGNSSTTAFTIPHGLDGTPAAYGVTPGSAAAAAGPFYVTADATNLTVTFTTAPATGTNNIVLQWRAEM